MAPSCVELIVILALLAINSSLCQEDPPWISLDYTMDEELDPGTAIANVGQDSGLQEEDPAGAGGSLQFNFLPQDNQYQDLFEIEENSGLLKTAQRIDRDVICENSEVCDLILDIGVLGPDREFDIVKVTINVRDLNDNAPTFMPKDTLELIVSESSLPGMTFAIQKAKDPDSGAFAIQKYEFESSTSKFNLSIVKNRDGEVTQLKLILLERLDREDEVGYSLQITAIDGGNPPLSGTLAIQVVVQDTNDNSPVFENDSYEATIKEDFPVNATILQVRAEDSDVGLNGQIVYGFDPETQGASGDIFAIKNSTGEIHLVRPLNYRNDKKSYRLIVVARDRGENSFPASARVTINVQDVNNHAPRIRVNALTDSGNVEVPENSQIGTFVAHVDIDDSDEGINGEFTCALTDPRFELEQLYKTIFKIRTTTIFDRETLSQYVIHIECEDHGTPPLRSSKEIPVTITDTNDHGPVFSKTTYITNIQENNSLSLPIIRVNATDFDSGDNARITYKILGDDLNLLSIDSDSGVITTKGKFDYETTHTYECQIVAMDNGDPVQSATASLVITVLDVNDEAPEFTQMSFDFATFENQPVGTEIGTVSATDIDTAPNNEIRFAIDPVFGAADTFRIDPYSGVIRTTKVLDREFMELYPLVVTASNPGQDGLSTTASVSIHVADVNDNAPMITFPSPTNNSVQLPINAKAGFIFAKIHAEDHDIGPNADLSYLMAKGNDEGIFNIDEEHGILSVTIPAKSLEQESYNIIVTVADGGQPPKTAMVEVNIVVNKSAIFALDGEQVDKSGSGLNQNQTILIALSLVTLVLVIILVAAIVFVKRSGAKTEKKMAADSRVHVHLNEKMQPLNTSMGSDRDDDSSVDQNAPMRTSSFAGHHQYPPMHHQQPQACGPTGGPLQEVRFNLPADLNGSAVDDDNSQLQILQVHRGSNRGDRHNIPGSTTHPSVAGGGPAGRSAVAPFQRLVTTPHDILSKPWMLTEKELEVHRLLQLGAGGAGGAGGGAGAGREDSDSASGCSNEGSNTDSGRGPSEDGEHQRALSPHKDNNDRPPVVGRRKRNIRGNLLGQGQGGRPQQYSDQKLQTFGDNSHDLKTRSPPPNYANCVPPPIPQRHNSHLDSRNYSEAMQNNPQSRTGNPYAGLRKQSDSSVSNSPYHRGILVNGPNNNSQVSDNSRTPTRHQGSFNEQTRDYNKNFPSRGGPNSIQLNNLDGSVETSSSDSSLTLVNGGENLRHPDVHRHGYMDSVV